MTDARPAGLFIAQRVQRLLGAELGAAAFALLFLGLFAALPVLVWLTSGTFVSRGENDIFLPLDAAWRWHWGQWPSRDFYSPIGVLYYAVQGLSFDWLAHDARSIARAGLVVLPFALGACALAATRRLGALGGLAALLLVGIATLSPHYADAGGGDIAWLASYNRHSWVIFGLVGLLVGIEPRRAASARLDLAEGAVLGLLLAAGFHMKASAGCCDLALALGAAALSPNARRRVWIALAVFAAVFALGWGVGYEGPYLADLRRAAASNPDGLVRLWKIHGDLLYNAPSIGAGFLMLWLGLKAAPRQPPAFAALKPLLPSLLFGMLCFAVSNQDHDKLALGFPMAALALLEGLRRGVADVPGLNARAGRLALAAALALAVVLRVAVPETQAIVVAWQKAEEGTAQALDSALGPKAPRVGTLLWIHYDGRSAYSGLDAAQVRAKAHALVAQGRDPIGLVDYLAVLNDGRAALARFAPGQGPVESLTFTNPYPFWTGTRPARRVGVWWHLDRSFAPQTLPDARWTLGDAQVVLAPTIELTQTTVDALEAWAQPALDRDYRLAGETPFWKVYVRTARP